MVTDGGHPHTLTLSCLPVGISTKTNTNDRFMYYAEDTNKNRRKQRGVAGYRYRGEGETTKENIEIDKDTFVIENIYMYWGAYSGNGRVGAEGKKEEEERRGEEKQQTTVLRSHDAECCPINKSKHILCKRKHFFKIRRTRILTEKQSAK